MLPLLPTTASCSLPKPEHWQIAHSQLLLPGWIWKAWIPVDGAFPARPILSLMLAEAPPPPPPPPPPLLVLRTILVLDSLFHDEILLQLCTLRGRTHAEVQWCSGDPPPPPPLGPPLATLPLLAYDIMAFCCRWSQSPTTQQHPRLCPCWMQRLQACI